MGDGIFRFDFLMPAEFFPLVLIGGVLLFWAARRAHAQQKFIGWSLAVVVGFLFICQGLAVVTGLASGETEPAGWPLFAVLGTLIVYILGVVGIGVGGIFLLRDLFKPRQFLRLDL